VKQATSLAFHQLQAHPMFARFHYSIRPKAIVHIFILDDLGGNPAALSAKLDALVLKINQRQ
jgi:hypothetical protein